MNHLIKSAISCGASDLHLTSNQMVKVRIKGMLYNIDTITEHYTTYSTQEIVEQVNLLLHHEHCIDLTQLKKHYSLNLAYQFDNQYRIRANIFSNYSGISCVLRIINNSIRPIAELDVPPQLFSLPGYSHGLILVTGKTGAGKSTTIAHIVQSINQNQDKHIITLEDPIEFVYCNQRSLIHQLELKIHTPDLKSALTEVLRQDANVIVIGELRTQASIRQALYAAETGHLVISTIHSSSTTDAINRLVHCLNEHDRIVLASTLKAIVAQRLIINTDHCLTANYEILLVNHAVQNLISEGKTAQIKNCLYAGKTGGMLTFEQHLAELKSKGVIKPDVNL